MHIEPPTLQHLGELPADTPRIDVGLMQPRVLERLARNLPDVSELTLMVTDPAALDGPPLPAVRTLRLTHADDIAGLWPRLVRAFPGVRDIELVHAKRLTAADLKPLATHGLRGLGLLDPPADAVQALAGWPGPERFTLRTADPWPWLLALEPARVHHLAVQTKGPIAERIVDHFGGPVLRELTLSGATDVAPARLAELTGLEALALSGAGRLSGLRRLGGLRRLELDGCIPDALDLGHLLHLERLAVRGNPRFDGGELAVVIGAPQLEWLDISDSPALVPVELMLLQTTRAPRALALRNNAVSGGLMHLRGLGIRHLDLRGCALDAGDFAELTAMDGLVRLDLDLLAWSVDRPDRQALLAKHPAALAHYRYRCRPLPDGAVEEIVRDAERPWATRTRVQGTTDGG